MTQSISHPWTNGGDNSSKPEVVVLANHHLLITADADTDADGSPDAETIDPSGQTETALGKANGWKGSGEYVNARTIPYFVLPGNWLDVAKVKCRLGDIAKLSYKHRIVYAIYADVGPDTIIGEASIAAVEALGHNPWNRQGTVIESGIPHGVKYEVIPGSSCLSQTVSFETIQSYGKAMFGDTSQLTSTSEQDVITWFELNRTSDGKAAITAYAGPEAKFTRYFQSKESLISFLQAFPNAQNAVIAHDKEIPIRPDFTKSETRAGAADRFVSYFNKNYADVRSEVERWFIDEIPEQWSTNPITNGCVAHQVSCLHLCELPHPDLDTVPSVNVDSFVQWALAHGWKKIIDMKSMNPGDICVSGNSAADLDHVYCFVNYIDSENAHVLHNQVYGLATRSLVGNSCTGRWRFALRMPG
jgi:hypothetical protein